MKKILLILIIGSIGIQALLSCSSDLENAEEALKVAQENKYGQISSSSLPSSSSLNLLSSSSDILQNSSSSSGLQSNYMYCQIGIFCLPMDADICSSIDGGLPVEICNTSSSSSISLNSNSSSSGSNLNLSSSSSYISQSSSSSSGLESNEVYCKIGDSYCGLTDATVCEWVGLPVTACE